MTKENTILSTAEYTHPLILIVCTTLMTPEAGKKKKMLSKTILFFRAKTIYLAFHQNIEETVREIK